MEYIFIIIILLFSVIIHEVAHGAVAYHLGDPTAKYAGRLSLNPLKHLDPIGSVILPLILVAVKSPFLIGWAKPVPVNPYNFKDQKYGSLKVSLAGPGANLIIALFFGLLLRFVFFPIPSISLMFSYIVYINILLAVFNLIPIPPLDGSHILFTFFPYSPEAERIKLFLERFGMVILIFIIFFWFSWVLAIINWIFALVTGFHLPF